MLQVLCKYMNEQVKAMFSTLKEVFELETTRNKHGQYYDIMFVVPFSSQMVICQAQFLH